MVDNLFDEFCGFGQGSAIVMNQIRAVVSFIRWDVNAPTCSLLYVLSQPKR